MTVLVFLCLALIVGCREFLNAVSDEVNDGYERPCVARDSVLTAPDTTYPYNRVLRRREPHVRAAGDTVPSYLCAGPRVPIEGLP